MVPISQGPFIYFLSRGAGVVNITNLCNSIIWFWSCGTWTLLDYGKGALEEEKIKHLKSYLYILKGAQEIMHTYKIFKRVGKKTLYYKTNQHFKDFYDEIYTIGYYSGFYSSQRDEIWTYGGHFEFLTPDEDE